MGINRKFIMIIMAALIVVQSACTITLGPAEGEQINQQTAVAMTVQALQGDQQPATITPDQQQQQEEEDDTPTPTLTPTVTNTPKPCNKADFVSETIADGTVYAPGTAFTKTWRFKNSGTCTWNTSYKLLFKSGDQMGGPASKNFPNNVAPGESVDLSVNLTSPATGGTYKGIWRVVSDSNEEFIHNIWAQIVVPSPVFAVTSVNLTAVPPAFVGPCPFPFAFTADITTNGPGTVTYYWKRSDSTEYGHASIVFGSAGTQTAHITSITPISGAHWMKIYIDEPNHQFFGPVNFILTCVP